MCSAENKGAPEGLKVSMLPNSSRDKMTGTGSASDARVSPKSTVSVV